ncbi:MAG: sulfotransferase family 2 domain-containing protein [Methylovirgula sp.]
MISHKYRCIFIHIQRTAGSSIEEMITTDDWWRREASTKHLLASQAKRLYADYWDDYFKFSFVRHPVTRVMSCLKFTDHFGFSLSKGNRINFDGYRGLFGDRTVVEFDHRFYRREEIIQPQHCDGSVYGNILDEELDFIGKFENLAEDTKFIRDRLGIPYMKLPHLERSRTSSIRPNNHVLADIETLYARDFERFDYSLLDTQLLRERQSFLDRFSNRASTLALSRA